LLEIQKQLKQIQTSLDEGWDWNRIQENEQIL
jgi:hypothetical protein